MPGVDLNYFIRQANKLTEKIEERKKELADETVEGKAGDGPRRRDRQRRPGDRRHQDRPKAHRPERHRRCSRTSITAAVNAALTQSREHMQKELGKISGGIKIPGIT